MSKNEKEKGQLAAAEAPPTETPQSEVSEDQAKEMIKAATRANPALMVILRSGVVVVGETVDPYVPGQDFSLRRPCGLQLQPNGKSIEVVAQPFAPAIKFLCNDISDFSIRIGANEVRAALTPAKAVEDLYDQSATAFYSNILIAGPGALVGAPPPPGGARPGAVQKGRAIAELLRG
jgi:hypothetical protein